MAFIRRHWVVLLIGAAVLVLLIALLIHIRHDRAVSAGNPGRRRAGQSGPVAVSVATAASGDIQLRVPALGTVTPLATVTVRT